MNTVGDAAITPRRLSLARARPRVCGDGEMTEMIADSSCAAEGAREMSDAVWQEKLASAQAETGLRRQEIEILEDAMRVKQHEHSSRQVSEVELRSTCDQLRAELHTKDDECRAKGKEMLIQI